MIQFNKLQTTVILQKKVDNRLLYTLRITFTCSDGLC